MFILLLYDAIARQRDSSSYNIAKIKDTLGQCIEDACPLIRQTAQQWLIPSQSGQPQAVDPADEEIRPETTEAEVYETKAYPTDARMGQKEKHKLFKEATGEKHQPKKKQKVIHPGKDDCGEDFSS